MQFNIMRSIGQIRLTKHRQQALYEVFDSYARITRPASADRTARRQFQAVFPVMTGSFPNNIIAHLHGFEYGSDSGQLPHYEVKCVERTHFQ